jgi:hypothetical protein
MVLKLSHVNCNCVRSGCFENRHRPKVTNEKVSGFAEIATPLNGVIGMAFSGRNLNRVLAANLNNVELAIRDIQGLAWENGIGF